MATIKDETTTNKTNNGANKANGLADVKADWTTELYRRGRASAFGLEGETLLEEAARAGNLDAQGERAFLRYLLGNDETRNRKRAFELAEQPAEAGAPFAALVWAAILEEGTDGDENELWSFIRKRRRGVVCAA